MYHSTRNSNQTVSSKQAILEGISRDGGLYVWPMLDSVKIDLNAIVQQNYQQNAVYILKQLLSDYTEEELVDCVNKAYSDRFFNEEITPLKKVGNTYVLELFHGPTSAFKDVALTLLPQLMQKALKTTSQKALILTATSGDTGKAALAGFQNVEDIQISVFYPHNKVSAIQYRQMATQQGNNVNVFAVEGNFDDAQSEVKNLFLDKELDVVCKENQVLLTSANSINIGRLVPQIVYYFEAYKKLVNQHVIELGDRISFSVPTGNFGDVLAGYYAFLMGLPVKKFYVASNANKVLTDFLTTGTYDRNRDFIQTISPSMDILISSNLERLLFYMTDQNTQKVCQWMEQLRTEGKYTVDSDVLKKIQNLFDCGYVDDARTKEVIRQVYEKENYVLDPHSAIAYDVAQKEDGVVVSFATASPYKFSQDVMKALGQEEEDEWKAMEALEKICQDSIPAPLKMLQSLPVIHKDIISIDQMKSVVRKEIL